MTHEQIQLYIGELETKADALRVAWRAAEHSGNAQAYLRSAFKNAERAAENLRTMLQFMSPISDPEQPVEF